MSEDTPAATRALSFGPAAAEYDRLRPRYPEPALRWALGDQRLRVVDLGAGTGILSRALVALGHEVLPVEPDQGMREQLAAVSPELTPLAGFAEQIPLPDGSVDAVMAGQAYHWFDPEPTHVEVARVLRPGGVFAPIWNQRDETVPWIGELSTMAHGEAAGDGMRELLGDRPSFGPSFDPVARETFVHAIEHTVDTLVGLIATRSYFLTAPPERQAEMAAEVRRLCAEHPELAGRERFELPYRTLVYRGVRSAD
ncbi:class I SAM-dependent methyltransferase [Natronosporangium hydrolyticum]|uniref:Class I SAM-dependent methyltransferase n=1 Tax=Natronosporangium hydrolyticum TaxID=2811111 RepID=A0A895YFK4_9ACTN|nr:class I SAM-dependent methyltransferase [Natronosporangium hydrolyticum]QSB14239.1 class I SAM-dependent methyltransferase [Natronosporangium hydrolyticum]